MELFEKAVLLGPAVVQPAQQCVVVARHLVGAEVAVVNCHLARRTCAGEDREQVQWSLLWVADSHVYDPLDALFLLMTCMKSLLFTYLFAHKTYIHIAEYKESRTTRHR